jgi:prepilin-type N-terminal cleavage/methylation domain-containing protein
MIKPSTRPNRRRGLSLLEVLMAMAIFLFSIVAISRLVIAAADRALETRYRSEAVQICQQKLMRVTIGDVPLSSQGDTPDDDDPDWHWSINAEQGNVANLWNITVKASRAGPNGAVREYCSLTQMVLDPSQRGSSFDTVTINGTSSNTGSATGSGSSSGGTGSTPAAGGGKGTGAATGTGAGVGASGGGGAGRGASPAGGAGRGGM